MLPSLIDIPKAKEHNKFSNTSIDLEDNTSETWSHLETKL